MRTALTWGNATLAFVLELAALGVLGWAGWHVAGPVAVRLALALLLPGAAAVLWGLFAAPRARHPSAPGRLAVQVLVFGAAAVLLGRAASPGWGVAFAVVVVVNVLAAAVLPPLDRPAT